MDPSTTRTNGSSSPRSALCHHSMNVSAPCSGPHSKSIRGQCTATLGSPGRAPSTISSMLGWVAAVSATEYPSHPSPPFIQRMWTTGSSCVIACHPSVGCPRARAGGLGASWIGRRGTSGSGESVLAGPSRSLAVVAASRCSSHAPRAGSVATRSRSRFAHRIPAIGCPQDKKVVSRDRRVHLRGCLDVHLHVRLCADSSAVLFPTYPHE